MLESLPFPTPEIDLTDQALDSDADALVIGLADDAALGGAAADVDRVTEGWLGRLVESDQLRGKRGEGDTTRIPSVVVAGDAGRRRDR